MFERTAEFRKQMTKPEVGIWFLTQLKNIFILD
jgi:hypothetical protein